MTSSSIYPTVSTLFVYQDSFNNLLLASCRIVVQPYKCINLKVKTGQLSSHPLIVKSNSARSVRIHTSNESIVKEQSGATLKLIAGNNEIFLETWCFSKSSQKVRVHCVDVDSGELIDSWIFYIEAEAPQITQMHKTVTYQGWQSF